MHEHVILIGTFSHRVKYAISSRTHVLSVLAILDNIPVNFIICLLPPTYGFPLFYKEHFHFIFVFVLWILPP
jgi:hypothetical protein